MYEDLLPLELPDFIKTLTSTRWVKTDDMDLYRKATEFEFQSSGAYKASFRWGEGSFSSSWSLCWELCDAYVELDLSGEDCDFRTEPEEAGRALGFHPSIEGQLLRLNDDLCQPAAHGRSRGFCVMDRGTGRLVASYGRPLLPGLNTFDFEGRGFVFPKDFVVSF